MTSQVVAPRTRPLQALVHVPGSKSVAARALICAALSDDPSVVSNLPSGDDTSAMLAGLQQLGAEINVVGSSAEFTRSLSLESSHSVVVDAVLAGTTARFLTAVAALRNGETVITGHDALRNRPMHDLHQALVDLGAVVAPLNGVGRLPVSIRRGPQITDSVAIAGSVSSQFTTGLRLIAPRLPQGLGIVIEGSSVSESYVAMTQGVQKAFGVAASEFSRGQYRYSPGRYVGCRYEVEPDASSASYPLAAAAIAGGTVSVSGLGRSGLQGDSAFPEVLARMGCVIRREGSDVSVTRDAGQPLEGIDIDMGDMSDLVPTLAVVATRAISPTVIRGVGFIRNKESDRIGDLAHEMRALGADVEEHDNGLKIKPSALHGATVYTHHDHRLAMSLALLGLVVPGVVVVDPDVVSKSWPEYWQMLDSLQ
jgi:3-phosphoshikimate 1-carboxyvinyltransferase